MRAPLLQGEGWWAQWSTTQIGGWVMDVLVDLSFHVRALIRALFDLVLLRIALRLHFLVLKPVAR